MRRRWRRDDVTPTSVKVTIGVFVLLGLGVVAWWDYEKHAPRYEGYYWHVQLGFLALLVVAVLVALLIAHLRRKRRS